MTYPVLEADEVQRLDRPRLLDVREQSAFEANPIEGARWVPVDIWIEAARSADASFVNLDYWQGQIAALGLSDQYTAVIFDDGRMTEAARVWCVLQFCGATAVVVNGGWPALKQAGLGGPAAHRSRAARSLQRLEPAWSASSIVRRSRPDWGIRRFSTPGRRPSSQARISGTMRVADICQAPSCCRTPTFSITAA